MMSSDSTKHLTKRVNMYFRQKKESKQRNGGNKAADDVTDNKVICYHVTCTWGGSANNVAGRCVMC